MDSRNVFVAIALSLAVLLFWSAFFETPRPIETGNIVQKEKSDSNKALEGDAITPNINQLELQTAIPREESIKKTQRIQIENNKIKGSLSLQGAIFDDLSFKDHKKNLEDNDSVVFLNPRESENGYFVETGWTSIGNKIKVPTINSTWSVKGNNILGTNKPIILEWNNNEGLIFRKKIELDEKYLFKINQEIQNNTNKTIELYPYAQITRNKKPDDVTDFYILHEGFIGVFDEELKEDGYDDIEDKKEIREANNGWLGITDKYWVTAIVPPKNENFKSTFLYKDAFKANYILNSPVNVAPASKKENQIRLFVAAKEVETIDSYAEAQKIEKFDLVIDWGWFYFFTKPLFFIVDYLFKITGNFGIAIVLITAMVRIVFFPLANYSFRSMAKMKALQPEMVRLKDVHKEDKVKLQQEMMSLYKKEKVNPASGCLPILIQIPFFFAIYKMLFISLEMRHQPFFGWIKDLSAQDPTSIFNLFGLIPWDPPGFLIIGIWPILMGLTMFLQQKLNPAPTDPVQAKIFMFFPLFLTIILAPFPSGLVVYWTINNILTIAQQWVIMRNTRVKTV
tara:strand:- start:15 stop:1712 length:1698 start_codon:yes stop_codon:yes gene_type:complete